MSKVNMRRNRTLGGIGLGMLLGAAIGAVGCGSICGMPSKRKVKRRLMHAADVMGSAVENMCDMMK